MGTSEEEKKDRLSLAAEMLYDDYMNDAELTVFCAIDHDDFTISVPEN